jgi:O-methyltransferase
MKKNIGGNVAELGVYRGDFAQYINIAFPDRKLYLFDTFEGFDEKDITLEEKQNYSCARSDFSKTSIERVLNRMKYKKR